MDGRIKLLRGFLRTFLLGALLLQAILVQSHVHPARLPASQQVFAAGAPRGARAGSHQQLSSADYCPLCWEAATAGHYPAPPGAAMVSAPAVWIWFATAIVGAFLLAQPPRGWQSRAPPQ